MITIKHRGSFKKAEKFLKTMNKKEYMATLRMYGQQGVDALEIATPKDTGVTANSWSYEIVKDKDGYIIYWRNSSTNQGNNIALLIQHGHGTGSGVYVKGIDYINPALKGVFDTMANNLWQEVKQA